ncbi:unnamed protein product [Dracunculus medinensis]|uniref:WD_REPEATS_REGION domain-containing protein n=1 Tax=Dracunculus medinensis TaxID=318479 RepID=A0A0N4U9I0_DRAME|nr:unnamed protein product [Dracunculus medinensis]
MKEVGEGFALVVVCIFSLFGEFKKNGFKKQKFTNEDELLNMQKLREDREIIIPKESLALHDTGASEINPKSLRTKFHQEILRKKKEKYIERIRETARAEILNFEEKGFLLPDNDERTYAIRQNEICAAVDLASASKHFDLILERFGPYQIDYTPNGRFLLIGGRRGHVAAFDWLTKKLLNETNVLESIHDIKWLHVETMYAVAQKRWTYIYDNKGTELHCLKNLHDIRQLEFLPRHFLLVAGAKTSFLHYLDVSLGKLIQSFPTRQGPLDVMTQNPNNAIIHTGHGNGTIQLWSPNVREPLIKLLAHPCTVQGISVEGHYMASTGLDRFLRIWDVRNYKSLFSYRLPFGLSQIFNDAHLGASVEPFLFHRCAETVHNLQFCPFEDVLGVGHRNGFTSLLVPGCGNPNFNALLSNPYESKSQRREREVKQLLDKIQPELIALDTTEIFQINTDIMKEESERLQKMLYIKPREIKFQPRNKKKGRSDALKKEQRKQGVRSEMRFAQNEGRKKAEQKFLPTKMQKPVEQKVKSVLDRFKRRDI